MIDILGTRFKFTSPQVNCVDVILKSLPPPFSKNRTKTIRNVEAVSNKWQLLSVRQTLQSGEKASEKKRNRHAGA